MSIGTGYMTGSVVETIADRPLQGFIDRLLLHSVLTPDEVEAMNRLPAKSAVISANRDFVHVNENTNHSYFVVSGIVGRFSQDADGIRQITALHIPGDMADLCSVVFPRSSWAFQALTKSSVLCVPHKSLRKIAEDYPGIAAAFWRDCVVDMSIMSEGMMTLSRRDGEAKIAHLLCEISCRLRRAGPIESDRFEWQLRQSHVAEIVGLTPVHVNRMLRSLRETGLMTVSNNLAEIHDFAGLTKIAHFDPGYLHLSDVKAF